MCLIVFNWQPKAQKMLTLASNRDEFYARPSKSAHFWEDLENIFGGRDLKMQGTWLAVSRNMRFAAVTNFRSPNNQVQRRSRGEIPSDFLNSDTSALQFAKEIKLQEYAGCNALLFDGETLVYCHNQKDKDDNYTPAINLPAGLYGLSNHLLNTPWPKVQRTKQALADTVKLTKNIDLTQHVLSALQNDEIASDDLLPNSGVGLALERLLSPAFITSPSYGTRTSTVVIIEQESSTTHPSPNDKAQKIFFHERQYQGDKNKFKECSYTICQP